MTLAAIALKRFQLRHRQLPPSLDALVPELLAGGYYIHPYRDFVRQWVQRMARMAAQQSHQERKARHRDSLSDIGRYEKFDGIWYYCENYAIKHEGKTLIRPGYFRVNDAIKIDGEVNEEGEPLVFYLIKWTEHISTKRQLNRKELKKAGLKNDLRILKLSADGNERLWRESKY